MDFTMVSHCSHCEMPNFTAWEKSALCQYKKGVALHCAGSG